MERTDCKKIRFKKTSGVLYYQGHKIKAGQTFRAFPEDIPESLRDTCVPLDPIDETPPKSATKFEIRHKTAGWYNVVEISSGKPINEKSLRQAEAEKLLEDLS